MSHTSFLGRSASRVLARLAAFGLPVAIATSCVADMGDPTPSDQLGSSDEAIHSNLKCARDNLRIDAVGALFSSYGNWCGGDLWGNSTQARNDENGNPPLAPINCWDAACRVHDYTFGRPVDGFNSCHSVFRGAGVSSRIATACIADADAQLCSGWSICTELAEETSARTRVTWEFRQTPGLKPAFRERVCVGDRSRKPVACDWVSHPSDPIYTCDVSLCPSSGELTPVSVPPSAGCAVKNELDRESALKSCCSFLPEGERPKQCPQCESTTCVSAGANCGTISDGCGGTISCGDCAPPFQCGAGGAQNQCACPPEDCLGDRVLDPSSCTCVCPANLIECGDRCVSASCGADRILDRQSCSCVCAAGTQACGDTCVAPCAGGRVRVPASCSCECAAGTELCGEQCISRCTGGMVRDLSSCDCRCPTGTEKSEGKCVSTECSNGRVFDSESCSCTCPSDTEECEGQCVLNRCSGGTVFNSTGCICECPPDTVWNPTAQQCEPTCSPPSMPPTPTVSFSVQGTCNFYSYDGPEAGLRADFLAFWSAHSACPGFDCMGITVTQNQVANTLTWTWQQCGTATQLYQETPCPDGYALSEDMCVCVDGSN
jgi:hypothetical protein